MKEWSVDGIDIVAIATPSELECNVHVLVDTTADLTVQYGSAGADKTWQFSKRVPLANMPDHAREAFISIPAGAVDKHLMFVLHEGAVNRWIKDGNDDFFFELPRHPEWDRPRVHLGSAPGFRIDGSCFLLSPPLWVCWPTPRFGAPARGRRM